MRQTFSYFGAGALQERCPECQPRLDNTRNGLLALCKRERIKVRDSSFAALRAQTRWSGARHPGSLGVGGSKSAGPGSRTAQNSFRVPDLFVGELSKHALTHRARPLTGTQGSRSPGYIDRLGVADGTCIRRISDSAGDAKGCARTAWSFGAESERDSLEEGILKSGAFCEASLLPPHLNPLPRSGGEEEGRAWCELFWKTEGSGRNGSIGQGLGGGKS